MTLKIKRIMNGSLLEIASSSNGRTADSDSVNLGSNPGEAANFKDVWQRVCFLSFFFILKICFYFFLPTSWQLCHSSILVTVWWNFVYRFLP